MFPRNSHLPAMHRPKTPQWWSNSVTRGCTSAVVRQRRAGAAARPPAVVRPPHEAAHAVGAAARVMLPTCRAAASPPPRRAPGHVASLRRTVPGSAHMIASRQTSAIAVWPQIATTTHHAAPVRARAPERDRVRQPAEDRDQREHEQAAAERLTASPRGSAGAAAGREAEGAVLRGVERHGGHRFGALLLLQYRTTAH